MKITEKDREWIFKKLLIKYKSPQQCYEPCKNYNGDPYYVQPVMTTGHIPDFIAPCLDEEINEDGYCKNYKE